MDNLLSFEYWLLNPEQKLDESGVGSASVVLEA